MDGILNLAAIHEALAEALPERECIVFRERRLRWRDVHDRTRRLADVLRTHRLGCGRERTGLPGWESGQDHVALYLYNGNEYLEGMLGAFKARAVPFNVNYRYVDEELVHLLGNADAKAVIYHASFAPVLARIRARLPELVLWLQVADESGEPLLPGALDYEEALAQAQPRPPTGLSPDDLYILYTGGTTGVPKGVLWRQEDIYVAALGGARAPRTIAEIVERARKGPSVRALPAPPFMHGAAHWAAFTWWHAGGTVVVPSCPRRLDPDDVWSTVERERVEALTIVGDAFARPLLDQLARKRYELASLKLLISGGAILTAALKRELLERLPGLRILDALGSSESGTQAAQLAGAGAKTTTGDFAPSPENLVLKEDLSGLAEPGSGERGWLAREGHIPLGYYKDPEKSRRTFPCIDGRRFAVPGDRAMLLADGTLRLLGRDSVTINTGGEKVFAEEVEHALKHHPSVYDAVVVGTPHPRWGQQVTALVRLREGAQASDAELREEVQAHLAGYKVPRAFVYVDEIVRQPSGKADYRWARARACEALAIESQVP
jgi:fatty-acyl-CoA synthase